MRLYIAEKPSVATAIADVLKGKRKEGYYEVPGGVVTWAFGHLFGTAMPEDYDPSLKKWREEDLPFIPEEWKLKISDDKQKQFKIIKDLHKNAKEVVNAGDPDREGQLLIHEILNELGNKLPVLRYWCSANEDFAVKKALENLEDDSLPKYKGMYNSALTRQRADFLYGINASRAYSLASWKAGNQGTVRVGRVKTPLQGVIVRREKEIKDFKVVQHFGLKALFKSGSDEFWANWKPKPDQDGLNEQGLITDKAIIDRISINTQAAIQGTVESCETEEKMTAPPKTFSLSSLQIKAGNIFGYSPAKVLEITQSLYDKKFLTYPRSDTEYLFEGQFLEASEILDSLKGSSRYELKIAAEKADPTIKSSVWNDKKVTAHHAIIPTRVLCPVADLKEPERDIYLLVAMTFIAQFHTNYIYDETQLKINVKDEIFTTGGRVEKDAGWKALYRGALGFSEGEPEDGEAESNEQNQLPRLNAGDILKVQNTKVDARKTTPPKRFTQQGLIQLMKAIHQHVKDPELAKTLKENTGIGTEATRSGIIQELFSDNSLLIEKKRVIPAEKTISLIEVLPDEVTYPDQTAIWEEYFKEIEEGKRTTQEFLEDQTIFIRDLCEKALNTKIKSEATECPKCKTGYLKLINGTKGNFWSCSNYKADGTGCSQTYPDKNGKPDMEEYLCPKCNKKVWLRMNKATGNKYYSCWGPDNKECNSNYPEKNGKPDLDPPKTEPCECGGTLRQREGKNGKFWGCSSWSTGCKVTFPDYRGKPDRAGKKKAAEEKKKGK